MAESGFGPLGAGLRFHSEIRRESVPDVGIAWRRPLGGDGTGASGARLAAGVWP